MELIAPTPVKLLKLPISCCMSNSKAAVLMPSLTASPLLVLAPCSHWLSAVLLLESTFARSRLSLALT